ncbi:hypothetical protein CTH30272_02136 [Allocatenococcus thiocycli]|nr:hypothetical protein CTH30272_02136 [Catenococcus thiocycli]
MANIATTSGFSLTPQSLDEAMKMAELMAQSEMVPKDYQGKPANVLVAVQMGAELGLKPVQALQNIAVVNGRPSVWGDGLRALIMSAPDLVSIDDGFDNHSMTAKCIIQRNINGNVVTFTGEFSQADAEHAGLWGRNTWKSYPKKMLEWRAFGFAARKAYADRLRGIQLAEESQDIQPVKAEEKEINPVKEPAYYSQDDFDKNFPKWESVIESGRNTPERIISMAESKGQMTDEMKSKIRAITQEQTS